MFDDNTCLSESLSCSSYFPQNPFISSSFTRLLRLLNVLVQKDQVVKLGLKRDLKNRMGLTMVGCGSMGLTGSIFFVPLNERNREMVNLRSIFSHIKGNNFNRMFDEAYVVLQELLCYLLRMF